MKIYVIKLMGSDSPILASEEDVARVVTATQKGAKLVRVRSSLINPSSISSITRSWTAKETDLDTNDVDIGLLGGAKLIE